MVDFTEMNKAWSLMDDEGLRNARIVFRLSMVATLASAVKVASITPFLAMAHDSYRDAEAATLRGYGRPDHVFCDLKNVFGRDESDLRL